MSLIPHGLAGDVPGRLKATRRSGRVVECAGLENRWARKGPVGSNPTSSACDLIARVSSGSVCGHMTSSPTFRVSSLKSSLSRRVIAPGTVPAMVRPSIIRTAASSPIVPVQNTSAAR